MLNSYFMVEKETGRLVSPFKYYDWSKPIAAAQSFSVTSVATVVAADLDGILRGKNDVLILSKSSLGEQPLVERINFFEREIDKGQPIQNLLSNTVYVCEDYNGSGRLWLELNVLEIDTSTGERKSAINAFQSLAATSGAVFPALLPYAMASSTVVKVVEKLFSALEKNTQVVRIPISFYPGKEKRGYAPFQEGTYVVFAIPQQPEKFTVADNCLLESEEDISDVSYTVFDIFPEERVSPEFVQTQKIATLLTQIRSGNQNTTKSSLEFLTETLEGYSNYRKLQRYLELAKKTDKTDKETELMEEIQSIDSLKPFLPTS